MATVLPLTTAVPSSQRVTCIEDVAVGDRIDVEEILGRPARRVRFHMTDMSDTLEVRLNSLLRLPNPKEAEADCTVKVWSAGSHGVIFSNTGQAIHETIDPLKVSSIEVTGLTLSVGTTITITVT